MALERNGKVYLTPEDVERLDLQLEKAILERALQRKNQEISALQLVVDRSISYLEG